MSHKGSTYFKCDDSDELASLSDRLRQDLRSHIRQMGNFDIGSERWVEMANTLARVAHVSDMEAALPKKDDSSTLWEGDEAALRFIMEDGKLNLCLRSLMEFKQHQFSSVAADQEVLTGEVMTKFEKGMGLMLRNAWKHQEAVQTTDLASLMSHISAVLRHAGDSANAGFMEVMFGLGDASARQECLVFEYLGDVLGHTDSVGEDRIMSLVQDHALLPLAAKVLAIHHGNMSDATLLAGARALALCVDTEHFDTYQSDYLSSEDAEGDLVSLRDLFVDRLSSDGTEQRRALRPLLKTISSLERSRK